MNVWENVWSALGWFALALIIVIFGVTIYVIIAVVYYAIKGKVMKSRKLRQNRAATQEQFLDEARVIGKDMYKQDVIFGDSKAGAFMAGARWAWGYFHRG
jgi:hypothetical protein